MGAGPLHPGSVAPGPVAGCPCTRRQTATRGTLTRAGTHLCTLGAPSSALGDTGAPCLQNAWVMDRPCLCSAWFLPPRVVFVVSAGPPTPRAQFQSCLQQPWSRPLPSAETGHSACLSLRCAAPSCISSTPDFRWEVAELCPLVPAGRSGGGRAHCRPVAGGTGGAWVAERFRGPWWDQLRRRCRLRYWLHVP